jgi:hypothetical protein
MNALALRFASSSVAPRRSVVARAEGGQINKTVDKASPKVIPLIFRRSSFDICCSFFPRRAFHSLLSPIPLSPP